MDVLVVRDDVAVVITPNHGLLSTSLRAAPVAGR